MFELMNVTNKHPLMIKIEHDLRKVEFVISSIINKRNKEDIDPETQFVLLESYINYKGNDFKTELFKRYMIADTEITSSVMSQGLHPMPIKCIHDIIEMFDELDVYHYIKEVYKLQAPGILADVFDEQLELDGRVTRVQTYIKSDYYELATVSLILKSVIGPIGYFGYLKDSEINSKHKEYILFRLLNKHRLNSSAPVNKVKGLIIKLIEIAMRDEKIAATTVIEKGISLSQLPNYVTAATLLKKIAMADLINDNRNGGDKNIVTRMYNFIINELSTKDDAKNRIGDKIALTDSDSGDRESIAESYRIVTALTVGDKTELDWSCKYANRVIQAMPIELDTATFNDAKEFCKALLDSELPLVQLSVIGNIFKHYIDPRGLDYISSDSLLNLFAIGFAYLNKLGFTQLAIWLTSRSVPVDSSTLTISSTVNRNRISKELKDELNVYFPYNRVINSEKQVNIAEEWVNDATNDILARRWLTTAYPKYLESQTSTVFSIPQDIKILLAQYIVTNEKLHTKN